MTRIYVHDTWGNLVKIIDRKIVRGSHGKKMIKYNHRLRHITHPSGTGRNTWHIVVKRKGR